MICFRDRTYCGSPNCENKCGRKPPADLKEQVEKWWGGPGGPVAYSMFCGGDINEINNNPSITERE